MFLSKECGCGCLFGGARAVNAKKKKKKTTIYDFQYVKTLVATIQYEEIEKSGTK